MYEYIYTYVMHVYIEQGWRKETVCGTKKKITDNKTANFFLKKLLWKKIKKKLQHGK